MNRRKFLSNSAVFATGSVITGAVPSINRTFFPADSLRGADLYNLFKNPPFNYHPFVRWWWNGNKVEGKELVRELRLLKEAGIGGVEINPVEFPSRFDGDDLGKPSLKWLSDEWLRMLEVVFKEAKSLGMICDLLVGSGWPFGAEYLEGEERSQIVVIGVKKIKGPV
ncbi:MAG: glycosyl hydrolase, partial [Bacteroidota bacterium]|nr:glycosyl hydrolase [Bacteroidota bacterium]